MIPVFDFIGFSIYTYPLMLGVAWGVGYHILKRQVAKYSDLVLTPIMIIAFISSWIGAKVFYLITTDSLISYTAYSKSFWLGGGFVFYGGLISAALSLIVYFYLNNIELKKLDIFVLPLLISHAIGRLGCFLAGCCFGFEYHGTLHVATNGIERFPVQILEALLLISLAFYIFKIQIKKHGFEVIYMYLFGYALIRFVTEFFRGDIIRGIWLWSLSTSQIISLMIILGLMIYILIHKWYLSN